MTNSSIERTLVLIKPDGMVKSLAGTVLNRLTETKLTLVGAKLMSVSKELAENHYAQLKDKPFFPGLIEYIQGKVHGTNSVMALVYKGEGAIAKIRAIGGATNPEEAEPTTIRGSLGRVTTKGVFENVIHASSSREDAEREINLWFKPSEILGN